MSTERTKLQREDVLRTVIGIVAEQMGLDPGKIGEEDRLEENLGCDSLDITEIAMEIEEQLDISIPDEFSDQLKAIRDITDGIMQLLDQAP